MAPSYPTWSPIHPITDFFWLNWRKGSQQWDVSYTKKHMFLLTEFAATPHISLHFSLLEEFFFRKCTPNHVCVFSPPRAVVRPFSFVLQYIEAASCCSLWEVALAFSWVSWCKVFLDCFSFWHFSTVLNLHLIDIVEVFPWMNTCSTIWQWRDKIHQRDQWQGVRFDRWHLWQLRPSTMSLVIVVGGERMPAFTYVYICN